MNAEEAIRCLAIAKTHWDSNSTSSAIRFCKKSISLNPTAEAQAFLARLEKAEATGTSSARAPSGASNSRPTPRASTSRPDPPPEEKREFTPAQAALVKRVRSCKVTEYYSILGVEKGCEDVHVKKAYRKLALGLHPDKCGAPGAEEAFKMVSKAFQILSDGNKRAVYDQTGADPDSRGGGGGGAASGFARGGGMGGGMGGGSPFADEMSPEDLFRFFFGQQGAGGGFGGGGGGFRTQFYGPGGVHMQSAGRRPPPRANGQAEPASSVWLQVAPLLLLFAFSLLTQLPSLFGTSPPADPDFNFSPNERFTIPRTTSSKMSVHYFVNARQFSAHPIYEAVVKANPGLGFASTHEPGSSPYRQDLLRHILTPQQLPTPTAEATSLPTFVVPAALSKFERAVERSYVLTLQSYCQNEIASRNERLERARGFFGIGADWVKVKEITGEKLEHCSKLSSLGYAVNY